MRTPTIARSGATGLTDTRLTDTRSAGTRRTDTRSARTGQTKRGSSVLLGIISLVAVIASVLTGVTAASADGPASPNWFRAARGSIGDGQGLEGLAVKDNSGTQDHWNDYIEFMPDQRRHVSVFRAPVHDELAEGQSLFLDLNFRGPEASEMRWRMAIRNQETRRWEIVWDNRGLDEWVWTTATREIADGANYVDGRGRVLLRFWSNNAIDVGQLDHLVIRSGPISDPEPPAGEILALPANVPFDYQIGSDYTLPAGVGVVSRDWFAGSAAAGAYNICYINAFQTQDDEPDVNRPDEQSNWPQSLVMFNLGDDPNWGGEYLINITTAAQRASAAAWVEQMVQTCAAKGFDAVEYDNLDSWIRFDGTPVSALVTFGEAEAIAYAELLVDMAHANGLAAAQKNTAELDAQVARDQIGFDFAVVESCGRYNECPAFTAVYGDQIVAIEYRQADFVAACAAIGNQVSVVLRDRNVTAPPAATWIRDEC